MNAGAKEARFGRRSPCLPITIGNAPASVKPGALDPQVLDSEVKQNQPEVLEEDQKRLVELQRRLKIKPPKFKALKRGTAESDLDHFLARAPVRWRRWGLPMPICPSNS